MIHIIRWEWLRTRWVLKITWGAHGAVVIEDAA